MKLKILELFAGTRSIGKAFEKMGHQVISIDWDEKFENIDYNLDIGKLTNTQILEFFNGEAPDFIWASPDCRTYSIAGVFHHRIVFNDVIYPKSVDAMNMDLVNINLVKLVKHFESNYGTKFVIENPRGMFRKMPFIQGIQRHHVTYCQYGDINRQKPTDLFSNMFSVYALKQPCKAGANCHESAPRGSMKGVQSQSRKNRIQIPPQLCQHIVQLVEEELLEVEE